MVMNTSPEGRSVLMVMMMTMMIIMIGGGQKGRRSKTKPCVVPCDDGDGNDDD